MPSSPGPPRTTQLLAERWATRFCTIQRRISLGEWLKFVGGACAAVGWFTFLILAKGTTDLQGSDFLIPGVLTAAAIVIVALGFRRERRARGELNDATTRLAQDLDGTPPARTGTEQRFS